MIRGTGAADVTYYIDGIPIVTTDGGVRLTVSSFKTHRLSRNSPY